MLYRSNRCKYSIAVRYSGDQNGVQFDERIRGFRCQPEREVVLAVLEVAESAQLNLERRDPFATISQLVGSFIELLTWTERIHHCDVWHPPSDLPIVLVTGYTREATPDQAARIGIREFLTKPFTLEQLDEILARIA